MTVKSCIPVIPSLNVSTSLKFWRDGLGFSTSNEMKQDGKLTFCMLSNGDLTFMLNQREGTPECPSNYEGIRLYWAPSDLEQLHGHLSTLGFEVGEIVDRDYGRTEFFVTDPDGFSHCFGVETT